jgi:competence protein ComFC
MAAINPRRIVGNWTSGYALDVHTLSSRHLGVNEHGHELFETKRSELGELLYRLKYRADKRAAAEIVATVADFLRPSRTRFDVIVPVPPSAARAVQPVIVIAEGVGAALGIPVAACIRKTRRTEQLKGVLDPARRTALMAGLYAVDAESTLGKNVLLMDDLYRSGSTLIAITELLLSQGKAATVRVLTVTRARSHQ